MASIRCAHCKQTHHSVAEVRACSQRTSTLGERMAENGGPSTRVVYVEQPDGSISRRSSAMGRPVPQPDRAPDRVIPRRYEEPPADGMYQKPNGDIFKVYKMVHGSGLQGCKLLVFEMNAPDLETGGMKFDPDSLRRGKFVYQGLAIRFVRNDEKMSLEQAQAFGKLYGFCCVCGRTLTDERSIEAGIGPVCAGKGMW